MPSHPNFGTAEGNPLICNHDTISYSRFYLLPCWVNADRHVASKDPVERSYGDLLLKPAAVGGIFLERVGVVELWGPA
jgi:hypothetical protein